DRTKDETENDRMVVAWGIGTGGPRHFFGKQYETIMCRVEELIPAEECRDICPAPTGSPANAVKDRSAYKNAETDAECRIQSVPERVMRCFRSVETRHAERVQRLVERARQNSKKKRTKGENEGRDLD